MAKQLAGWLAGAWHSAASEPLKLRQTNERGGVRLTLTG